MNNFWLTKKIVDFTEQEWEMLCDGCGLCCYQQFITSRGRFGSLIYTTSVACNQLDLKTQLCTNYANRFSVEKDCLKITKDNLPNLTWLPPTCAYRLIGAGKQLPKFHPLITHDKNSAKNHFKDRYKYAIHMQKVKKWEEYIISYARYVS